MMTATEPADRASLHALARTCGDRAAHCRALHESHSQILPLASSPAAGGGFLASAVVPAAAHAMLRQSAVGLGTGKFPSPRLP